MHSDIILRADLPDGWADRWPIAVYQTPEGEEYVLRADYEALLAGSSEADLDDDGQ
jgi:hypothetical protein